MPGSCLASLEKPFLELRCKTFGGLLVGLVRDDIDGAAESASATKCALTPMQHFDPHDIGQPPVLANLASEVDTIHVDPSTGVGGDQVSPETDSPNEHIDR